LIALIESPALAAPEQMALDELLLEAAPEAGSSLRFFEWSGPAVTFGYSQTFEEAFAAAEGRGLGKHPVVRRPTGGGVVFHDGDVTFSLVFKWPEATAPQSIYKDIHRAAHLGLKSAGMSTRLFSPPAPSRGGGVALACFPNPVAIDLVTEEGAKVLGGALRKRKGWGLYQGSLRPEGLGEAGEIREALAAGLLEGKKPARREAGEELLSRVRLLAGRRYRSDDWNKRR
jgi:lipoate-protein ligase A